MSAPARARRPRRRRGRPADLGARVWIAIPAVAYALVIISLGGTVFAAGILLLGFVCVHELFRMYEGLRPVRLAGFIGLAGLAAAANWGGEHQVLLAVVAFFPVMFVLGLAMPERPEIPLTDGMMITLLGTLWIGLALAHAVLLRELPHGGGLVLAVLLGTFVGDTAAYLGGRALGTRPLAARISPSKTVEGLACGIVGAALAVWWYGLSSEWMGGVKGIVLGLVVGVLAPLGDLFESKIKRDAGTKDAGTLFGAHGGALDRLDAAFFTLVGGYYVWLALT
ncbi:MAG: phosphatidate cytidylyltransferase [Solirubrobacteraceae bacterium]